MRKLSVAVLAVLVFAAALDAQAPDSAKPRAKTPAKSEFSLSVGAITDLEFDRYWSGGFNTLLMTVTPRADKTIARNMTFSMEIFSIFGFSSWALLSPGFSLNYERKGFFAGAGFVVPILVAEGGGGVEIPTPKFTLGIKKGGLMLSLYWLTSFRSFMGYNGVGASIGYRFGQAKTP